MPLQVIDHDHGSAPGLLKHSETKPQLPPVDYMELADPHHNETGHVHEAAPVPRTPEQQAREEADPTNTVKPAKPPNPFDAEVTMRCG